MRIKKWAVDCLLIANSFAVMAVSYFSPETAFNAWSASFAYLLAIEGFLIGYLVQRRR